MPSCANAGAKRGLAEAGRRLGVRPVDRRLVRLPPAPEGHGVVARPQGEHLGAGPAPSAGRRAGRSARPCTSRGAPRRSGPVPIARRASVRNSCEPVRTMSAAQRWTPPVCSTSSRTVQSTAGTRASHPARSAAASSARPSCSRWARNSGVPTGMVSGTAPATIWAVRMAISRLRRTSGGLVLSDCAMISKCTWRVSPSTRIVLPLPCEVMNAARPRWRQRGGPGAAQRPTLGQVVVARVGADVAQPDLQQRVGGDVRGVEAVPVAALDRDRPAHERLPRSTCGNRRARVRVARQGQRCGPGRSRSGGRRSRSPG